MKKQLTLLIIALILIFNVTSSKNFDNTFGRRITKSKKNKTNLKEINSLYIHNKNNSNHGNLLNFTRGHYQKTEQSAENFLHEISRLVISDFEILKQNKQKGITFQILRDMIHNDRDFGISITDDELKKKFMEYDVLDKGYLDKITYSGILSEYMLAKAALKKLNKFIDEPLNDTKTTGTKPIIKPLNKNKTHVYTISNFTIKTKDIEMPGNNSINNNKNEKTKIKINNTEKSRNHTIEKNDSNKIKKENENKSNNSKIIKQISKSKNINKNNITKSNETKKANSQIKEKQKFEEDKNALSKKPLNHMIIHEKEKDNQIRNKTIIKNKPIKNETENNNNIKKSNITKINIKENKLIKKPKILNINNNKTLNNSKTPETIEINKKEIFSNSKKNLTKINKININNNNNTSIKNSTIKLEKIKAKKENKTEKKEITSKQLNNTKTKTNEIKNNLNKTISNSTYIINENKNNNTRNIINNSTISNDKRINNKIKKSKRKSLTIVDHLDKNELNMDSYNYNFDNEENSRKLKSNFMQKNSVVEKENQKNSEWEAIKFEKPVMRGHFI